MHQFLVNASIQKLTVVHDKHHYECVDEAIAVIQQSGIRHEVGPFTTILEGTYQEVMNVIHAVNEHLVTKGCNEWISSIQIQIRSNDDITGEEKIQKFR